MWLYFGIYVRIFQVCLHSDAFPFEVFIHSCLHISIYLFLLFLLN